MLQTMFQSCSHWCNVNVHHTHIHIHMIRTLLVEGHAISSVHALGALDYMHSTGMLDDLCDIYCYSFGALIIACYCLTGGFRNVLRDLQTSGVKRACMLLQCMLNAAVAIPGIRTVNSSTLRNALQKLLPGERKLGDLQRSGICVHVLVCCADSLTTRIFNSSRHADVDLLDVLMASCALPFVFRPVRIGTEFFIDGGVYSGMSHIRTRGKGSETVLVGSTGTCKLHYGLNCFEQLWTILLAVQKTKLQRRARGIRILNMPLRHSITLRAGPSALKRMYYTGATLASAEFALHALNLSTARMKCCGLSAYTAMIPLPATQSDADMMRHLQAAGVSIVHAHHTHMTWRRPLCNCCCTSVVWSSLKEETERKGNVRSA